MPSTDSYRRFHEDKITGQQSATEDGVGPADAVSAEAGSGDGGFAVSSLDIVHEEQLKVNSDI